MNNLCKDIKESLFKDFSIESCLKSYKIHTTKFLSKGFDDFMTKNFAYIIEIDFIIDQWIHVRPDPGFIKL